LWAQASTIFDRLSVFSVTIPQDTERLYFESRDHQQLAFWNFGHADAVKGRCPSYSMSTDFEDTLDRHFHRLDESSSSFSFVRLRANGQLSPEDQARLN